MIEGLSVLAIIPARGGSQGLTRKNVRLLGGKPLIAWTIEAAQASVYIDRLVLSSEDEEIIEIGQRLGCDIPFPRPSELAGDTVPTIDVLHHLLRNIDRTYDLVVQLQPTSPLRKTTDIDGAIRHCITTSAPACVSVCAVKKNPHWIFSLTDQGQLSPLLPLPQGKSRRQDMDPYYELNGAIYVAQTDWILQRNSFLSEKTVGYVMPADRSQDIDSAEDLALAEQWVSSEHQ
jgi:N-acylneuraminate cytidylyltransferase